MLRRVSIAALVVTVAIIAVPLYHSAFAAVPGEGATGSAATAAADGVVDTEDGVVPDGVTVFDDGYPAVTRLSPDLLDALRTAAHDAAADGIVVYVNSGWRSPEYQERLLEEAVAQHGSAQEAARWVATASTSAHVAGEAVDVGSFDAVEWLTGHGAAYGLCQTYGNEAWHFELRREAIGASCPPPFADPTQDPRMRG